MIHWGELLALVNLNQKAEAANAELKRIREEIESTRREQQREREEWREELRRAAPTPQQRAEEDRQRREAYERRVAEEAEAKRKRERDKARDKAIGVVAFWIFVLICWWAYENSTPYQPPKPNLSAKQNQSATNVQPHNELPPGTLDPRFPHGLY
jgi:phage-related minor tail protein